MAIVVDSQTKLTYEDYALLPEDGRIHEIIEGDHHVTPAPDTYHQTVSRRLQFQLYEQIEEEGLGLVFNAPTDVQLSDIDIVQPDLLVILESRRSIIGPKKIMGPPDRVVEILSESGAEKDTTLKRDLYQKAGVPEYWIVDSLERRVTRHRLTGGRYDRGEQMRDEISFTGLPQVRVDLGRVW